MLLSLFWLHQETWVWQFKMYLTWIQNTKSNSQTVCQHPLHFTDPLSALALTYCIQQGLLSSVLGGYSVATEIPHGDSRNSLWSACDVLVFFYNFLSWIRPNNVIGYTVINLWLRHFHFMGQFIAQPAVNKYNHSKHTSIYTQV